MYLVKSLTQKHVTYKPTLGVNLIKERILQFQILFILPPQKGLEFPGGGGFL